MKILIVTYTFPPSSGVGGRRWVKFAKYFRKEGNDVTVVTTIPVKGEHSPWDADLNGLEVIRLPRRSMYYQMGSRPSLAMKIRYKLKYLFPRLLKRGNFIDDAVFWRRTLYRCLDSLFQNRNFDLVIGTGAPFNVLHYLSTYKDLKQIRSFFLFDIRDPWTWAATYGFSSLSEFRKNEERKKEEFVIQSANAVTVPVAEMKDYLSTTYPDCKEKMMLLDHGFDHEEIVPATKKSHTGFRIVLYGSIYPGLEAEFESIAQVLKSHSESASLDIFSNDIKYEGIFKKYGLEKIVCYRPPVSSIELFSLLAEFDAVLIVQANHALNYITTKFYEIIYSETPIIYIGGEGNTSRFILENKVGVAIQPHEITEKFTEVIEGKLKLVFSPDHSFSDYSFLELSKKLLKRISEEKK